MGDYCANRDCYSRGPHAPVVIPLIAAILMDVPIIAAQQTTKPREKATTIVGRVVAKIFDMQVIISKNHPRSSGLFVISFESKGA
jgi:hypothetical protein